MKKCKAFGLFICAFLGSLVFAFISIGAVFVFISNFTDISTPLWVRCFAGLCGFFAVVLSVLIVRNARRVCKSRFSFWLSRNFPKLFIGWFLLVLALFSAKGKPAWDVNTVYDILSLQWTIWGLALAIFLVWDGIVIAYLKRIQPEELDSTNPLQKCRFLLRKESFLQEIESTFSSVIFLTVNLFLLLFSTIQIYLKAQPDSVFTQSVLYCSFFFTTNSIAGMFLDILKLLNREKSELLEISKVTKEDLDYAQTGLFVKAVVDGFGKVVADLDPESYPQEEKEKILNLFLDSLKETIANRSQTPQK